MADAKPAAPAKPFNPMLLVLFALVFLVLFSPGIRNALGAATGFVLDPLIGFGGEKAALTLLLASLVTGTLTSVARHYLIDHVKIARVQETIRAFQKEFSKARKEQNTYKVKRMTDLQPELMKLQGEMTGSQMKPMVITMLVVIPVFAWLATWIAAPVGYHIDAPDDALLLLHGKDTGDLFAATTGGIAFDHGAGYFVTALPLVAPGGTVEITRESNGAVTSAAVAGPVVDLSRAARLNLTAGTWVVAVASDDRGRPDPTVSVVRPGSTKTTRYGEAIVLVPTAGGHTAVAATVAGAQLRLDAPAEVLVLVPLWGAEPRGSLVVTFDGPTSEEIEVEAADHGMPVLDAANAASPPPHTMALPWNTRWDLQASWKGFFPHWILIYSLFSIPIGQLVQKALKGLQFSRQLSADAGA